MAEKLRQTEGQGAEGGPEEPAENIQWESPAVAPVETGHGVSYTVAVPPTAVAAVAPPPPPPEACDGTTVDAAASAGAPGVITSAALLELLAAYRARRLV